MRKLSTIEAAAKLGIHRGHLQRLVGQKKVKPPPLVTVGGVKIRLWSPRDVERARKALRPRRGKLNKA